MSGAGSPTATPESVDGTGLRIAIVAGTWHETISTGLVEGAQRFLERCGAHSTLIRVPGSFELPLACQKALESGFDGVVALGVIIRGGTPHFEYVSHAATSGLTEVALSTGKPVGFGVLTLDTEQQGLDRAGFPDSEEDKGAEAADAVVRMCRTLEGLTSGS